MGRHRKSRDYEESMYNRYKHRYDYYSYLHLCAMRENLPLKDVAKAIGSKPYKAQHISAGITRISKEEAVAIAAYYKIRMKMWATKSVYIYALFEDEFSPEEREEILRQRIWITDAV